MKSFDMSQFYAYCEENAYCEEHFTCNPDNLLRYWREAKEEYLYKLFGSDQLILSKQTSYNRSEEELEEDLERMVDSSYDFVVTFKNKLRDSLELPDAWYWTDSEESRFYTSISSLFHSDQLLIGKVEDDLPEVTIAGQKIKVSRGQKIMKTLGKIAALIGCSTEFEAFRVHYSQILNQKKVSGKLCLSIHPLDYATCSDNESGWSSCMSWQSDGCYRLGTVEMMNSPMVICAYLASGRATMTIDDRDWNSKKWRAWIVINDKAIMCNRNYPYDNKEMSLAAMKWVAELAKENLGWEYRENIRRACDWYDMEDYTFEYVTNYMYCDFTSSMFVSPRINLAKGYYIINYSGVANCMNCGNEIPFDADMRDEANRLCCDNCLNIQYCEECGCALRSGDDIYYGPNGETYCEDCFSSVVTHCEYCDEDVYTDDISRLSVCWDPYIAKDYIIAHREDQPKLFSNWKKFSYTGEVEETPRYDSIFTPPSQPSFMICSYCLQDLLRDYINRPATAYKDVTLATGYIGNFYSRNWINPEVINREVYKKIVDQIINDVDCELYMYMYDRYVEKFNKYRSNLYFHGFTC